jgi:SAM-dependent methyltransferase
MNQPEFDRFAASYKELLKDPIRDRFTGGSSEFFQLRKRNLIRDYFRQRRIDTRRWRYLDVGCGQGELLTLFREDFDRVQGCDSSPGMLSPVQGVETKLQEDPLKLPFGTAEFEFVTAVCVFHHVPPANRLALAQEVFRVLKPGGVFAVIEHNPYSPATRVIVSRTPIDADALLLKPSETRRRMVSAGMLPQSCDYFLFLPGPIYRRAGRLEQWLAKVPLGGQHVVFGIKKSHE